MPMFLCRSEKILVHLEDTASLLAGEVRGRACLSLPITLLA